jgi:VCBS repeat-containing protein
VKLLSGAQLADDLLGCVALTFHEVSQGQDRALGKLSYGLAKIFWKIPVKAVNLISKKTDRTEMAYTISTQQNSDVATWSSGTPIVGQAFKTQGQALLDTFTLSLGLQAGSGTTVYNAYLYEYDTSTTYRTGNPIWSQQGLTLNLTNDYSDYTIDLSDPEVKANTNYVFYIQYSSGPTARMGTSSPSLYPDLGFIYTSSVNQNPYSNAFIGIRDFAFKASFIDKKIATATPIPISAPVGNFNEQTGIAINLSGTFGGTGTFDIANPEQSGNNDVKTGKYGALTVNNNGEFFYSVNLDKVDALNTGDNPADEFTINLTSPTGAVSSATYRVQIEGYTDPTPGPGPTPTSKSITITGNRGTVSGKPGIIVDGDTTGFDPGTKLVPYVRFPGQTQYTEGSARPEVGADGGFTWQRKTGKKTYVYFKNESESVQSNRVIVPAAFKNVAGGALSDAGLDPIISGGTSPFHKGHSEGKAKRNRRSPAFSLVDSEANAPAFGAQLMAADPFSTNTVGADTGLFPVASGDFI